MTNLTERYKTPFTFSQSSLQDYVDCSRRFQLRYIDQVKWPAIESDPVLENEKHQIEGQTFHKLAQQYLLGIPIEKLTPLASSDNLKHWWENFLAFAPQLSGGTSFTEATLVYPIEGHRLIAKYDLILIQPNGHTYIFDWKTYRKRPKDSWLTERLQTKVYLSLISRAEFQLNNRPLAGNLEMNYWFTNFPEPPLVIKYDQEKDKVNWAQITKLVKEISAKQSFPMTEDEAACKYCVFRSYCERGISAGEDLDGEGEISGEDLDISQIEEIEF